MSACSKELNLCLLITPASSKSTASLYTYDSAEIQEATAHVDDGHHDDLGGGNTHASTTFIKSSNHLTFQEGVPFPNQLLAWVVLSLQAGAIAVVGIEASKLEFLKLGLVS